MRSANIKNLSIALEALSRIPRSDAFAERIDSLLDEEIQQMTKEQNAHREAQRKPKPEPDEENLF